MGLVNDTVRLTPQVSGIPDGSWVVSYWADKSSTTTAWTPSGLVTTRGTGCGTSSARICSALADSAAKVPGRLRQHRGHDRRPVLGGHHVVDRPPDGTAGQPASGRCLLVELRDAGLRLRRRDVHRPEHALASYDWDFGDGTTSTDAAPSHAFAAAGSYDVTLTVTDAEGLTDSVTHQVTVDDQAPPIEHVASAAAASSTAKATVTVPSSVVAGDRLLLVTSVNSTSQTFTDPAGWTQARHSRSATRCRRPCGRRSRPVPTPASP